MSCIICGNELSGKQIKYCSVKCKDKRPRQYGFLTCPQCGIEFRNANRKYCSRDCSVEAQRKYLDIPDALENGDRKIDKNIGYVRVYVPMHPEANTWGYVYEHRIVVEQELGRRLKPNEVVHHKNGIRWDNSPSNLEVMDRIEHSKLGGQRKEDLHRGRDGNAPGLYPV